MLVEEAYLSRAGFDALELAALIALVRFFLVWLLPGFTAGPVGIKQMWCGLCLGEMICRYFISKLFAFRWHSKNWP